MSSQFTDFDLRIGWGLTKPLEFRISWLVAWIAFQALGILRVFGLRGSTASLFLEVVMVSDRFEAGPWQWSLTQLQRAFIMGFTGSRIRRSTTSESASKSRYERGIKGLQCGTSVDAFRGLPRASPPSFETVQYWPRRSSAEMGRVSRARRETRARGWESLGVPRPVGLGHFWGPLSAVKTI